MKFALQFLACLTIPGIIIVAIVRPDPQPTTELTLEQRLDRVTKRCANEFRSGTTLFANCVIGSAEGKELAQRLADYIDAKTARARGE
jgi:hypothetical protein